MTFLFCHAIELFLKAYLKGVGTDLAELKRIGHRIKKLAEAAVEKQLNVGADISEVLTHIESADTAIEARYIVTGCAANQLSKPYPLLRKH